MNALPGATGGGVGIAALTTNVVEGEEGLLSPGSALWHAQLFNKALEREGSRLSSRGSQRLGSSHSSRTALSSREGVRRGLPNLRAAEVLTRKALADHEDADQAHTARAKLQTTEPNTPGETWRGKPGHRPNTTTGNPREARMKLWQSPEEGATARRGGVGSPQRSSPRITGQSRDSPSRAIEERVSPMTPADKQGMIQKSLTSFHRYFKEMPVTQVPEIPGPSLVQSASVEAYLDISGSDMSDEELLETLASLPGRHAQLKPHPKVPQNELFTISQRAERLDRHRRQKKGQGMVWGSPKKPRIQTKEGERATGVEFKSTGLLAHTELERLRTVDESRKNEKPERGRVAHCCSLLERLQVKYFDEELGMLKEELFRAIFSESEALKRMPVPRNREEFLNAKPFFELWQQEKDRMDSLQMEIKKYKEEAENQASVNQQLLARVKLLTDLSGKGGGGGGVESGVRCPPKSLSFESEASLSPSMLRGSVSTANSFRQSTQKLHRRPTPEDSLRGDTNWPIYAGTEPDTASSCRSPKPQLHSMSMPASAKHMSFRSEARLVPEAKGEQPPKDSNPFLMAVPRVKLVASEIDNFEEYLRMQRVSLIPGDGTDPNAHQGSHSASFSESDQGHALRNEGHSEHNAPHSMSTRKVLQEIRTAETHPGVEEGDDEENGTAKPPPGHTLVMGQKMRRRKGVHEARWRDFSIYLSRHRELCSTSKEKLNTEYDKWRFSFDYKAPFPAMLRALERHKQVEVVGDANDQIVYNESLGQDLEQSSDEEEDLEDAIAMQERRVVKLQVENTSVKARLEEEMSTHTVKLEQRMEELERLSDQIFESAKKNFEARVQTLQERVEDLEAQLREKEEELSKVKYLLQDGDSLAAKLKVVTEDSEQAAVRFARREKQLLDVALKDKEAIEKLQKQIDVADAIMKAGRDQLKVKVGFHTQRMRVEEQTAHQEQLREIERLFQEKLELAELKGNVRQLTVKMSEKRFNVIMDILQRLDERIESVHKTQLGTAVSSSVFKLLDKQTKTQFSDARLRLLQQVTVDTFDSDSDAEYHNPEIGRVRTSEVQTDLTPANLGLEEPAAGGGKKKGKKGGKKGKKKGKTIAADPLAPIDPEKVRIAQGLVDAVYQQLEPTLDSSLGQPIIPIVPIPDQVTSAVTDEKAGSGASLQRNVDAGFLERCLLRYLMVKCGHKDVATRELEGLKETFARISGSEMRCTVFARLCNFFAPMPPEMTHLLLTMKASCWHVQYPALDWSQSVRASGLPLGSKGEGPEARDGVVKRDFALAQLENTCRLLQLRFDLAVTWLAMRVMVDQNRSCEVLSVEAVMIAATAQLDRKIGQISKVFEAQFPPAPLDGDLAPVDETVTTAPKSILTLDAVQRLLDEAFGAVSYQQALEVMVDLTQLCGARAATGGDFAQTCLGHIPSWVAHAPPTSQWHRQNVDTDNASREPEDPYTRDSTFLTTEN